MANTIKFILVFVVAILAIALLLKIFGHLEIEWPTFVKIINISFLVLMAGLMLSTILSQIIGIMVAGTVTDEIVNSIKKGLTTAIEEDHRLSHFEMNSVKRLILRTLRRKLPMILVPYLLLFYLLGAVSLILEVVYLMSLLKG
ncbi:MAG: hypothetical protein BWK79_14205 [Beggiatoa sp. IS2]|nr:MAG: hypothetical protein BWK79_14205 [Beggiatoa sp. IS2]